MSLLVKMSLVGLLLGASPAAALEQLQTYDDEAGEENVGAGTDLEMAPQVGLAAAFTLKPLVETSQTRLFLGELASCSGTAHICGEAYAIDLGPSPEPGRTAQWHSDKLAAILAKEWPGAQLQMRGPKMIKVSSAGVLLDEARLLGELKARLEAADPDTAATQIVVEHVALVAPVKVHPGELVFDFPELGGERWKSGHRSLSGTQRLTVLCRSRTASPDEGGQTFAINAQLTVKERRWVASRALTKGTILQGDDLTYGWLPASRGGGHYADNLEQLAGRRLRRDVALEAPLLTTDVETPRLLKRGQTATLQLHNHGLDVTSQVRILADATAGQAVEAMYMTTKKKLRVTAIDSQTVQLAY